MSECFSVHVFQAAPGYGLVVSQATWSCAVGLAHLSVVLSPLQLATIYPCMQARRDNPHFASPSQRAMACLRSRSNSRVRWRRRQSHSRELPPF